MKNLSVENIYTRQKAKELTKKNFWRLLGMMLVTGAIIFGLVFGGVVLLANLTGAQWKTAMQSAAYSYSYQANIDPTSIGAEFFIGFAVLMLVVSLLGVGLNLGLLRALTDVARGEEKVPVGRVFSRMKYFLKGWGLSLWVGFKTMLWALVVYLPVGFIGFGIAVAGDPQNAQLNETTAMLVAMLPLVAIILVFALVIPAMLRYFLSTYVLADEPSTGVFECVRKSKAMMKGHKWQLFKLPIPFMLKLYGWLFLIILAMSVVMVLVQQVESEAISLVSIIITVATYVVFLWKMLVYALRSQVAYCLFYLKRKGETPAIPPEEEERIVAWQPAAEKTAPESVATDAANIGCWNPGGEVKPEKE